MTLSELKNQLQKQTPIVLHLPDQSTIPAHFHVTEVGQVQKQFVDCGGTFRTLNTIRIQLWVSSDVEHRLTSAKWLGVMEKAEQELGLKDVEIEWVKPEANDGDKGIVAVHFTTPKGKIGRASCRERVLRLV